jgi:osmotically-inducible protein OsmY
MRTATTLSLAFSIGGILLLAGCSTAPNATGTASADSGLEQIVKAKLDSDPSVQAANIGVAANSARNEVTVSGTVPSETLRLRAVELAKSAQPNLVLTDKIQVKPAEVSRNDYTEDQGRAARDKAKALGNQVGKSLDDAWTYSIIMARLAADPDTSAIKVHVDVTDKVVTLRGRVGSVTAKTEAERLAKDTQGVSAVHNLLTVAPEG